ncbi:hypothetical protein BLTE_21020 [Blastochloris tepida]|uniref:Uncharacterized protein n=1 Tax=Blastochloris tepida TaxID=2233851 RepID=A0A348G1I4_9HYPH|nr:hypothetical protein BLTE_21020 [Blastochloris tepida]
MIAIQLTVSRANVGNEKDIGRAINALFLAGFEDNSQKEHDLLAMAGALCVIRGIAAKSGPAELEPTSGGCVITIDS